MFPRESRFFPITTFRWVIACNVRATIGLATTLLLGAGWAVTAGEARAALPKIRVAADGRGFVSSEGRPFVPFGVNYFRPGTGWAPQVWKQFDAAATRRDFAKLRGLGGNCVRVFLTFGSFYMEPGKLAPEALAKFDQFLALAEEAGIYVHPTGPDHWEGLPEWAQGDRLADETVLSALEQFWKLFAARYRGRNVIFAYDLLNEPEVRWDTAAMQRKWNVWLAEKYRDGDRLTAAWGGGNAKFPPGSLAVPGKDAPPGRELLDFQHFREDVADAWSRRQVAAIKSADPQAMVTVGLIQWSVPVGIAAAWHYSGFRPERQAPLLDFMEIHFYPLANGFYEYRDAGDEQRNLAYLENVVREVARFGKPTVVAEFGWYGGGTPTIDKGTHPFASEEQQARWCRRLVESTTGLACGWLNWSLFDIPKAGDVTEYIGLLAADGREKAWGRQFALLAGQRRGRAMPTPKLGVRPAMDWDRLLVDHQAREKHRQTYLDAYRKEQSVNDNGIIGDGLDTAK